MNNKLTPLDALNILVGMSVVQQRAYEVKPIIETELKEKEKQDVILQIIKEKDVNIIMLKYSRCLEDYNNGLHIAYKKKDIKRMSLTQTDFDLLKGWLDYERKN